MITTRKKGRELCRWWWRPSWSTNWRDEMQMSSSLIRWSVHEIIILKPFWIFNLGPWRSVTSITESLLKKLQNHIHNPNNRRELHNDEAPFWSLGGFPRPPLQLEFCFQNTDSFRRHGIIIIMGFYQRNVRVRSFAGRTRDGEAKQGDWCGIAIQATFMIIGELKPIIGGVKRLLFHFVLRQPRLRYSGNYNSHLIATIFTPIWYHTSQIKC